MIARIANALASSRFTFSAERGLQDGIASVLGAAGVPFERERPLSPADVPDFTCGATAVEVKIKGSLAAVTRQLHRYAQHPEVEEILLVTTKAAHTRVARLINGKRVHVHFIVTGAF